MDPIALFRDDRQYRFDRQGSDYLILCAGTGTNVEIIDRNLDGSSCKGGSDRQGNGTGDSKECPQEMLTKTHEFDTLSSFIDVKYRF